ncbi:MAG: hypothetical protein QW117_02890 [Candidatus Pacearchaeota archaeon]
MINKNINIIPEFYIEKLARIFFVNRIIFIFLLIFIINELNLLEKFYYNIKDILNKEKYKKCKYRGKKIKDLDRLVLYDCLKDLYNFLDENKCPFRRKIYTSNLGNCCYDIVKNKQYKKQRDY